MIITTTSRGFAYTEFKDYDGEPCSMQKSSRATEDLIWLGMDEGTHVDGECLARMHLNRAMAAELIMLLQAFVDTGELPTPPPAAAD